MLENKCALVTGSSRGIGRAVALLLAENGATVAVNYVEDKDGKNLSEARETASMIKKNGGKAAVFQGDVGSNKSVVSMVEKISSELGHIDILVNNAAILADRTLKKMDEDEWNSIIKVNLTGIYNCAKSVIDTMIERQWGRIISMSSISGQVGFWGQTNYAASKAGVIGFTKSLARELAAKKITVNAVAPGIVETDMAKQIPEEIRKNFLTQIPAGRFAKPEEIGELVCFLASDKAAYITGQTISINGGWFMQ